MMDSGTAPVTEATERAKCMWNGDNVLQHELRLVHRGAFNRSASPHVNVAAEFPRVA